MSDFSPSLMCYNAKDNSSETKEHFKKKKKKKKH